MKESATIEWLFINKTVVSHSPKLQRCFKKRPERIEKLEHGKNYENNSHLHIMWFMQLWIQRSYGCLQNSCKKTKHEVNQEGPVGRKGGVVEFTGGKETVIYFVLGTAHRL